MIGGGGTVVEHIFANFEKLLPFQILKSYEMGVRWTWGRNPRQLGPGPHWRLPLLHSILAYDIVDEVMNLPTQSVITKDGKAVCFSVNIAFRIADIVKHACSVQDFNESTAGAAMIHLAKKVRERDLAELETAEGLGKLEKSLRDTLTTKMHRWGTEIVDVGFTDFVASPRMIRLFLDANMGNKSS
jgi:regulator of protease activity HflC (stomatin/prohibitin superfamily)